MLSRATSMGKPMDRMIVAPVTATVPPSILDGIIRTAVTTTPWASASKITNGCTEMLTCRDINADTMDVKRDAI
jgi:hypothetical protein